MTKYAGYVNAQDGMNGPAPFDGPNGWQVDKMQQTEVFRIIHNLNLSNPHKLRVAVTTSEPGTIANIQSMTKNDFTVTVWTPTLAPAQTSFQFVALL